MMNIMEIDGYRAIIQYDPDIEMFRGEFVGLNGGGDFYARDIDGLRKEGQISLKVFMESNGFSCVKGHEATAKAVALRVSPQTPYEPRK